MLSRAKIIVLLMVVVAFFILSPRVNYDYIVTQIEPMPTKATQTLISATELQELWLQNEPFADSTAVSNITPYWLYKRLLFNGLTQTNTLGLYGNFLDVRDIDPRLSLSHMALSIAQDHVQKLKGEDNQQELWWKLVTASLCVYIQQNWTLEEIGAKYKSLAL